MSIAVKYSAKMGKFSTVNLPDPTPEEQAAQVEARRIEAEKSRITAYRAEADPLFFKWQAGETTEQEWLDARQSVRERYPYPNEE